MLKFDWNILFMLGNLVIFYLLMKKFFFGKIMKTMDARKELIEKQFKDAENANNEALELKKQYEVKIKDAERESNRIISEAKENAKAEYGKILSKAETDAQSIKKSAKEACDAEHSKMLRAAREDIVSLAMQTAEKIVATNVCDKTNSDIYDEFLNESSGK